MSTPFRVSLVAASGVFFEALLVGLLHHDTFNGHSLTPLEELPTATFLAVIFSALALLGTWLGTRRGNPQRSAYRTGLAVVLLYVVAVFLADALIHTAPKTVTLPSHEANISALEASLIGTLWGIGAPYVLALLVSRFRFFRRPNGA
jgi:quinol-cytochrome oxidoreductase complex cytochrome b subunit